jgi:hypothetical protein
MDISGGALKETDQSVLRSEDFVLIHPASPEKAVAHHGQAEQKEHAKQEG